MVSEVAESRSATEAELEAQQALATEKLREGMVSTGERVSEGNTIPGLIAPEGKKPGMTYRVAPSDAGAWVMIWELFIDHDGNAFGKPVRAPRGQLGLWLMKTRPEDGGPRFQVEMPPRVMAEPQYPCLHEGCKRKKHTRAEMVEHVEVCHPRTARIYRKTLDQFIEQAASENPRVAEIAATYAGMAERGQMSVEVVPTAAEENIDVTAGKPVVQNFGIKQAENPEMPKIFHCTIDGCQRFFDTGAGLNVHRGTAHKNHVPREV